MFIYINSPETCNSSDASETCPTHPELAPRTHPVASCPYFIGFRSKDTSRA
ncbi:hypothetical protein Hanom_Chr05g00390361 [Helianthus anomalus]